MHMPSYDGMTSITSDMHWSCRYLCSINHLLVYYITGDLKLVEKPQPLTMAPHDFCNIKANVKVASTENGIIFGNIGMYLIM